jgi:tetratricopeptide (TPR) repeat protein
MEDAQYMSAIREWLDSAKSGSWRLIIDNYDQFTFDIAEFLPRSRGAIFFTSRQREVAESVAQHVIYLDCMEPPEAASMLLHLAKLPETDFDDAKALVIQLGCLPLAITQAAAYIRVNGVPIAKYTGQIVFNNNKRRRSGDEKLAKLFKKSIREMHHGNGRAPQSVMSTWDLTYQEILEASPLAAQLLQILSVFAFDGIPRKILELQTLNNCELITQPIEDSEDIDEAMGILTSFALVTISGNQDEREFHPHRLVSLWMRMNITNDSEVADAALKLVIEAFPLVEADTRTEGAVVMPHTRAIENYCDQDTVTVAESLRILLKYRTCRYLYAAGSFAEAEAELKVCFGYHETHDPESRDSLECMQLLGQCLLSRSELDSALLQFQKVYDIRKMSLGDDHLDTNDATVNIATTFHRQGKFELALSQFLGALTVRSKLLKETDPKLLPTLEGIAEVYRSLGQYDKASDWFSKALNVATAAYGYRSAVGYHMVLCLVDVHRLTGKTEEATVMFRTFLDHYFKAVQDAAPSKTSSSEPTVDHDGTSDQYSLAFDAARKIWGEKHPRTIDFMDYVAKIKAHEGHYEEALSWGKAALELSTTVCGPHALITTAVAQNLASISHDAGLYDEAHALFETALEGTVKIVGADHPNTFNIKHNMGLLYMDEGRPQEALELFEIVYRGRVKILGEGHEYTIATVSCMADIYTDLGDYTKAVEWYQRAAKAYKDSSLFGRQHSLTLDTQHNMAELLVEMGESKQALEIFEGVLANRDSEHLKLLCMGAMVRAMAYEGQFDAAREMGERALEGQQKLLPKNHPEILETKANLAECLKLQGKLDEALVHYDETLILMSKALGSDHPGYLKTMVGKADVLSLTMNNEDAVQTYQQAWTGLDKALGPTHPVTIKTIEKYTAVVLRM